MLSTSRHSARVLMSSRPFSLPALLRPCRPCPYRPSRPSASASSLARRQLSTLAILEQSGGHLNRASLSAVTAAKQLGHVTAFVAGADVARAADEASRIDGLDGVIVVENPAYEKCLAENLAPLMLSNVTKHGFTHVVATHSSVSKNFMPRLAAMLDVQPVSDIIDIDGEDTFTRPIYAGNALLTVKSADPIKLLTVRGTAFEPPPPPPTDSHSAEPTPVKTGEDPNVASLTEWVAESLLEQTSARPDLATAARVVAGGRAFKSKEDFEAVLSPLADTLGAAIGASRAAVDAKFADNSLQVGQTGKNVAPELYVAVGISGAIQHLSGMKDSKVIVAINKNADAPIFDVADVGMVGDLFVIVPELTEKLKLQLQALDKQ